MDYEAHRRAVDLRDRKLEAWRRGIEEAIGMLKGSDVVGMEAYLARICFEIDHDAEPPDLTNRENDDDEK